MLKKIRVALAVWGLLKETAEELGRVEAANARLPQGNLPFRFDRNDRRRVTYRFWKLVDMLKG